MRDFTLYRNVDHYEVVIDHDRESYIDGESRWHLWCEENATGPWNVTKFINNQIHAYFAESADAMMFMLKFGGR